uniref:Uncharacterized protein n=1 Tax=Paramormyrops kingsleyae TaxID=1676925 RepID=A0A3B3QTR8_9TELE
MHASKRSFRRKISLFAASFSAGAETYPTANAGPPYTRSSMPAYFSTSFLTITVTLELLTRTTVLKQNTVIRIMETVDDAIAAYIRSVLPSVISQQSLVGTLKDLGVETLEDLKYVQEADLSDVLRPTEARMLISRFKVWSDESAHSEATKDNFASGTSNPSPVRFSPSCQAVNAGNVVDSASSSYADTPSSKSSLCSTQSSKSHEDHDWHHDFAIPWSNMPSAVKTKLEKQERPSARERREIVRLIVDEILSVCKKPRKKHLAEVARRMVLKYPKSFKDIVARQTIGSGYDSLTKQFQCRVDNLKREGVTFQQKRPQRESLETDEGDEPKTKKIARDSYGCINWLPCSLPASETSETQKQKQQQLVNMHKEKEKDQNKIEKIMNATFCTQRKDIITGTDTSELMKMWPYLFEMCGAKAHFLKLTGVSLNSDFDVAMTKKCRRIQDYFQSLPRDRRNKITKILCDIKEASTSCAIAGTVQILLAYFNEAEDKIIVKVEDTCLPREVTDEQLPARPCIVVCGTNALTANRFMVSIDKVIVNKCLSSFADALVLLFTCYYALNINYPVEACVTLEFLQR